MLSSFLMIYLFTTQVAVYVPCVGSTQTVLEQQQFCHGFTLVAGRQTQGKGRGGNIWMSPLGCCMFSTQVHVKPDDVLFSRPGIAMHMGALAMVQAAHQTTGIKLSIKWPNDIWLEPAKGEENVQSVKMGGVLVTYGQTGTSHHDLIMVLGIGLNLDNASPTRSLNNVAEEQGGRKVGREELVASALNCFEKLLDLIEAGRWAEAEKQYYEAWVHTDQKVKVVDEEQNEERVTVVGIDNFGPLKVDNGVKVYTVTTDGNTFDRMVGLITPKARM